MELQRGICVFCSDNNKVIKPVDALQIIQQIPNALGQVNTVEFQKVTQCIKLCPNCSVKLALARTHRSKIKSSDKQAQDGECICHLCKNGHDILRIETEWKYFSDRAGEFRDSFSDRKIVWFCTECLFFLDSVHCLKTNFFRKYPQTRIAENDVLKSPKKSPAKPSKPKTIILSNLQPISKLNYRIDNDLKLNPQLYHQIPFINLFKERKMLENARRSRKRLGIKIRLQQKRKSAFKTPRKRATKSKKKPIEKFAKVGSETEEEISNITLKLKINDEFEQETEKSEDKTPQSKSKQKSPKSDLLNNSNEKEFREETDDKMDEFDKLKSEETKPKTPKCKGRQRSQKKIKSNNETEFDKLNSSTETDDTIELDEFDKLLSEETKSRTPKTGEKSEKNTNTRNSSETELDEFDKLKNEETTPKQKSKQKSDRKTSSDTEFETVIKDTDKAELDEFDKLKNEEIMPKSKEETDTNINNETELDQLKSEETTPKTPKPKSKRKLIENGKESKETKKRTPKSKRKSKDGKSREKKKRRNSSKETEKSEDIAEELDEWMIINSNSVNNIAEESSETEKKEEEEMDEFDKLKLEKPKDEFDRLKNEEKKRRKSESSEMDEFEKLKLGEKSLANRRISEDDVKNAEEETPKLNSSKMQRRKSIFQPIEEQTEETNEKTVEDEEEETLGLNDELMMKPSETVPDKIMEEESVLNEFVDLTELSSDLTDKVLQQLDETINTDLEFNTPENNCSFTDEGKRKRNSSIINSGEKKKKKVTFFESV